ncbi:MAG: NADPH-dependent FMN reductase [Candidatus Promineifilaceae bacterium]|jgi:chromate reductase, NAD(P)H dehydrogenase (quinone)
MNGNNHKQKILAIAGSLREASQTRHLLSTLPQMAPESMEISIYDLHDIPLYNQDVEDEVGFPPEVQAFRDAIAASDGLIIATPEYNGSVPGVLKNSIDWASRQGLLAKRPVAPISGSPGALGATKAQEHLRSILGHLGMYVLPRPAVAIPKLNDKLQDNQITDDATQRFVSHWLEATGDWIDQLSK